MLHPTDLDDPETARWALGWTELKLLEALVANAELAPLAVDQLVNEQRIATLRQQLHDARDQLSGFSSREQLALLRIGLDAPRSLDEI